MDSTSAEHQLSVADALSIVDRALKEGDLEVAATLCHRVLEVEPDSPFVLNLWGTICAQGGNIQAAIEATQRALSIDPNFTAALSNLGNMYFLSRNFEPAEQCYRRAIELAPDKPQAYSNLGHLLFRQNRYDEALKCYEMAVSISPDFIHLYERLGVLVTKTYGPNEGAELFKDWLRREPNNPIAEHMLSVCEAHMGQSARPRCDPEYIKATFDRFAPSFDKVLTGLNYQVPHIIADKLRQILGADNSSLDILDAGCGTGLCAEFLRPYARHLLGVDLSPGMLSKAKDRQLYDGLIESDLVDFLDNSSAQFDLVVSADTLLYFGDLALVFKAAYQSLRPCGQFVFTLEACMNSQAEWELTSSGRYSHARSYLERELQLSTWKSVSFESVSLRSEHGQPVSGWLVCCMK